jgi:hypothetical protein
VSEIVFAMRVAVAGWLRDLADAADPRRMLLAEVMREEDALELERRRGTRPAK